jgi:hypothetical protein
VIVFINGPFGVGKTTVAKLLVRKTPNSVIYDPEMIGYVLKRALGPFKKVDDYQDYALWPTLVVGGARLLRKASLRTLVIPMTVWRRDYFDPIISGLRRVDPDLLCFKLTVPRNVLMDRISSDTEDRGAYAWRASHAEICVEALRDPAFGTEMRTDELMPVEVADMILKGLTVPTG